METHLGAQLPSNYNWHFPWQFWAYTNSLLSLKVSVCEKTAKQSRVLPYFDNRQEEIKMCLT
ncbi:MAG: hypothetical protein CEO19_120 [Parcubacteria group bacterium Gr01-1014_73]|nr:MAG: hypothetical protein CEO19_120 [Parcubacteria group bacterium Gr01-1014_73]